MDIVSSLSSLGTAMGGGLGVWLATAAIKKMPSIPVNEGQTSLIRATAGALSVIAVALLGFVNGNLQPHDLQSVVVAVIGVAVAWGTSHVTHQVVK